MILAILYSKVPHMLHALQNISLIGTVVLEKKSFERFLPYMGMAAILNFWLKGFMYRKFCVIFSQLSPPTRGLFMIQLEQF